MKIWIFVAFLGLGFAGVRAESIGWMPLEVLEMAYWQVENNRQARDLYIEKYRVIAVEEMRRTGIPASIKLAQGLLESDAGRSDLATKANNHFGIKCGGDWQGKTYYKKDDDYKNGKLVASCFRSYKEAEQSFMAHSAFLSDPKKVSRYGFLFDLDPLDYKAWAHGLRQSGYATNPKYGHLLITLIEDLGLHQLDLEAQSGGKLAKGSGGRDLQRGQEKVSLGLAKGEVNGVKVAYAQKGQTLEQLAKKEGVKVRKLERYNEGMWLSKQMLPAEEAIFLNRKRKKYKGTKKFHWTQEEEALLQIAQRYGVRSSALAKRNKVEATDVVRKGEKVKLRGWFGARRAPRVLSGVGFETKARVHTVERGETLFGLSRRYGVSVEELKSWNGLQGDTLQTGQLLKLNPGP
jgi:LysM repeat protein